MLMVVREVFMPRARGEDSGEDGAAEAQRFKDPYKWWWEGECSRGCSSPIPAKVCMSVEAKPA